MSNDLDSKCQTTLFSPTTASENIQHHRIHFSRRLPTTRDWVDLRTGPRVPLHFESAVRTAQKHTQEWTTVRAINKNT